MPKGPYYGCAVKADILSSDEKHTHMACVKDAETDVTVREVTLAMSEARALALAYDMAREMNK